MIQLLTILCPLACAALAWTCKGKRKALRAILLTASLIHAAGTALICIQVQALDFMLKTGPWLHADKLSQIFLGTTSFLFLAVALHTVKWLPAEHHALETKEHPDGLLSEHIFISCLLAFLSTMTLVILAANFGLLWVAVEATTLVSAPLILFHRSARSLEAMWKYLLICSVGIGLALFGTMLLAAAMNTHHATLSFSAVAEMRNTMNPAWFKAAFIFIIAGYGTKMGLAPFHTWLPDAHSEAPGTVSALLSGSLLNCSFLAILRFMEAAPDTMKSFCAAIMTALGLISLATAAFFIIRQTDFKRMLAYSSVEHMGLLVIFFAAGAQDYGLLHLAGHSVIKMSLFLIAGNILLAYGTRQIPRLGGLASRIPVNAFLWTAGIAMICGMPPSPLFVTEFMLLFSLSPILAATVLVLLFAVFAGMTCNALKMTMGPDGKTIPQNTLAKSAERLSIVPFTALALAAASGSIMLIFLVRLFK